MEQEPNPPKRKRGRPRKIKPVVLSETEDTEKTTNDDDQTKKQANNNDLNPKPKKSKRTSNSDKTSTTKKQPKRKISINLTDSETHVPEAQPPKIVEWTQLNNHQYYPVPPHCSPDDYHFRPSVPIKISLNPNHEGNRVHIVEMALIGRPKGHEATLRGSPTPQRLISNAPAALNPTSASTPLKASSNPVDVAPSATPRIFSKGGSNNNHPQLQNNNNNQIQNNNNNRIQNNNYNRIQNNNNNRIQNNNNRIQNNNNASRISRDPQFLQKRPSIQVKTPINLPARYNITKPSRASLKNENETLLQLKEQLQAKKQKLEIEEIRLRERLAHYFTPQEIENLKPKTPSVFGEPTLSHSLIPINDDEDEEQLLSSSQDEEEL